MIHHRLQGRHYLLLLLVVIASGIVFRTEGLFHVETRTPDERIYTNYAVAVVEDGLPGVRTVFMDYLNDSTTWIYPGPTRLTHVVLFATVMKVTGLRDSRAGAIVSWAASVGSLLLTAWIGYRFIHPWVGLIGVSFMTACFGELGCARRAWGDATAGFLSLAVMLLVLEIRRSPGRRALYLLLFAVGAATILNKETAILAYGLCGIWLAVVMAVEKRSWPLFNRVAVSGIGSIAAAIVVWIILAGSGPAAWASLHHVFGSGLGSDAWGQEYASGPWYQFIYFLWLVGPATLSMAVFGLSTIIRSKSGLKPSLEFTDRGCLPLLLLMTLSFIGAAAFGPNLQYLRIMAPANGSYCLLAGLGVWQIFVFVRQTMQARYCRAVAACVGVALMATIVSDYKRFDKVVIQTDMQDMSVKDVRDVMRR